MSSSKTKFYTHEMMLRIDSMLRNGMTLYDVADHLDRSYEGVQSARSHWVKLNPQYKIVRPKSKPVEKKRKPIPIDRLEEAFRVYRDGKSYTEVAAITGLSRSAIYRYCKDKV